MGYWGDSTATADFCEPNYLHSHYVAELFNTISSIPIVMCGLSGMLLARGQQLGIEQACAYAVIFVVGIGSMVFHATLLRTGQVLDEVPMVWAVLVLIWTVLETSDARRARRVRVASVTTRGDWRRRALMVYACSATAVYFRYGFEVFIVGYAVSVAVLAALAAAAFHEQPTETTLPRRLLAAACCTYGGGFACLWLPGELLCHSVPLMQRLPLHALFHITSAAGPHLGLTAFALARYEHERPTAPSSALFGGLPAIDRGTALLDKAV